MKKKKRNWHVGALVRMCMNDALNDEDESGFTASLTSY